jgi:Asp-tRNA(Asn)/Glu-tRNA(Gln) amidotransferase A subunit family amidase
VPDPATGSPAERARLAAWEEAFRAREPEVLAFVADPDRFARVHGEWGREGPLAGCLLGVKDIFQVAGLPTRAGSRLPAALLAGAEGPCVAALRAAGAVVAGKTATTEFAYFAPGPTRNPAHLGHTPGGSSSGSAAAIAAGLCDLALGTQTIGSIGRPAAYCGVVGFKPSYERISRDGVIPLAPSVDHVGLLSPDVASVARGAAVAISDWRPVAGPGAKPRLGIPVGPYFDALSPAGVEHFARLRAALERAGYELTEVEAMPDFAEIAERHRRLVAAEAAQVHAAWFAAWGAHYAAATAALIERGRGVPAAEAERSRASRLELRARLDGALAAQGLDLWLSPPATGPAPRGLESTGDPIFNLPWTHAGVPALVVPAGQSAARFGLELPMGAQLAARFGADEELLAWGAALEHDLVPLSKETAP